jgi:predicted MFS family arabinose efflux permease
MADRHGPWPALGGGLVLMLLAYLLLWAFGQNLAALVAGVVVLDLGAQAAHISNQARIFALREEVRNRLNTVYMVMFFVGGASGSSLAAYGWGRWGWAGVCAVGTGMLVVALGVLVVAVKRDWGKK